MKQLQEAAPEQVHKSTAPLDFPRFFCVEVLRPSREAKRRVDSVSINLDFPSSSGTGILIRRKVDCFRGGHENNGTNKDIPPAANRLCQARPLLLPLALVTSQNGPKDAQVSQNIFVNGCWTNKDGALPNKILPTIGNP